MVNYSKLKKDVLSSLKGTLNTIDELTEYYNDMATWDSEED